MKKQYFALIATSIYALALAFSPISASAQDKTKSTATANSKVKQKPILIAAKWLPNQTMTYMFEKTRRGHDGAIVVQSYEVAVKVLQRMHNKGYQLELTLPSVHLPGRLYPVTANQEVLKIYEDGLANSKGMRIVITTDKNGNLEKLDNWQEVGAVIRSVFEKIFKDLGAEERAATLKVVESLYGTERSSREYTMTDFGLFLTPLGEELVPGEESVVEGDSSAGEMGGFIKSKETWLLKKDQPEAGLATITVERTFDRESLQAKAEEHLKKLNLAKPPTTEALIKQMDLRDASSFVIDLKTGWLVSAELTRDVGAQIREPNVTTNAMGQAKYRVWRK
jgi:hypothetical protein